MKHIRNKMKARKGIFHFMEEQRKAEIENMQKTCITKQTQL